MKKVLKIIGIVLGIILLLLLLGVLYIQFSGVPTFENKAPTLTVRSDSTMVAEGARLATMVCVQCHTSDDGKLGGAFMESSEFGDIHAPNITQHPQYGITDYTDGELAYLLRTGIRKDGQYSPPWMPKFPHLSDKDLHSIIAFLRSDHPLVQPSDNVQPLSKPSFLTKFLTRVAFGPLPYPEQEILAPDPSDKVAYGKYLATAKVECYSCHSADFKTINLLDPEKSEGYMGGGNHVKDREGNVVISSNLTMDRETGLGKWTEAGFIKAVRSGVRPHGPALRQPMMPFPQMTEEEVSAIWAYLQTVPVIHNPDEN